MKIKFGMFITDGVGKAGGHVIQKNHYGLFVRTLVIGANPQTTFQQDRRAQLQFLTQNWRELSLIDQNLWIAETVNYPRTNSIGDTYFLTGQALYIGLNMNLWKIGQPFITTPALKVIPPDVNVFTFVCDVGTADFTIAFPGLPIDIHTVCIIYATKGISTGIFYVSTRFRSFALHAANGAASINFGGTYFPAFPTTAPGEKVFVKIVTVDTRCGSMGIPFFASAFST